MSDTLFKNIILCHFDHRIDPFENLLLKNLDGIDLRDCTLHLFVGPGIHIDMSPLDNRFSGLLQHEIPSQNLKEFRFTLTGAVYFPHLPGSRMTVRMDSAYRSPHDVFVSDLLLIKAYEEGIRIIRDRGEMDSWLSFDEIYEDRLDSPIKEETIYGQVEFPVIKMNNPLKVYMGYGSRIYARSVILNHDEVRIGRGSHIGCDCELNVASRFTLGDFSIVSSQLTAIGQSHTTRSIASYSLGRGPFGFLGVDYAPESRRDIRIGSDVWIGARVILLPGVTIGHGAVVGAGSVVTKDVPPYTVVAGAPASEIRKRFSEDVIEYLLEIRWWEWDSRKLHRNRDILSMDIEKVGLDEIRSRFEKRSNP